MSINNGRKFFLRLFFSLLFVGIIFSALSAEPGNRHEAVKPVLENLPERVTAAIERDRLVSVSMAVVLDTEIIFSQAFGLADIAAKGPASPETIYPVGSITKVFTATMLARLCEQGVVNLEDPVEKYLPEYRPHSPFPGTRPTTLRQLAAHTAGLPQDAPVNFWCDFTGFTWLVTGGRTPMTWYADCESLLQSLGQLELVYPPEVHAHYSNLGMQILGAALVRAGGESFTDYIESQILKPLEMNNSGFNLDSAQKACLARGYVCTGPDAPMLDAPPYELGCAIYSGGLFSTTGDLAKFLMFQFRDENNRDAQILSIGARRRMRTPQSIHLPGVHSSYGLGWGIVQIGGYEAIEHNGALIGYHAHVSAIPDLKLGIIAFSNTKNFLWKPDACKTLARSILADLANAIYASSPEPVFEANAVNLELYTGNYALPGEAAHFKVSTDHDRLLLKLMEVDDFTELFEPVGRDMFCFTSDPQRTPVLHFEPGLDGRIGSLTFLQHTFQRQRK
ncbi:MAG: serine hydrolase [candidate division Zixibacteria bacterium]|nr:serine hydrolase [candidate division Zixibacteria bacterium]